MPIGVYIHIPFCLRKCPYCDFYSVPVNEQMADAYTAAVVRNIQAYAGLEADTLYFGGGTPILLGERLLTIFQAAKDAFGLCGGEITLEANPCLCDYDLLCRLREGGFNRISIGLQSADDRELAALGRMHDAAQGLAAIEAAHRAGFTDISADLMLAVPQQTHNSLMKTLRHLTALPLTHVSAYMLKLEEGTPFGDSPPELPDEDSTAQMYLDTVATLEAAGLAQYEISNFARAGYECRHNLKYWRCQQYLGIGPAAHSYLSGARFAVDSDIAAFLDAPHQSTYVTDEAPGGFEERLMLALRLREGMALAQCAPELTVRIQRLVELGMMEIKGERCSLTPRGMLISNELITTLLV